MNWKVKGLLQLGFSALPRGHDVNFLFQRYVTHGLPVSERKLDEKVVLSMHHVQRVRALSVKPLSEQVGFEFGAGWDLAMPLLLYCLEVDKQVLVDIRPLRRSELVYEMAGRLRSRDLPDEFVRRPHEPAPDDDLDTFLGRHGIDYRAPVDARATAFAPGSVDFITSTNTLEHIPPADILRILIECRRLVAPDGVMSFQIDYQDHYSYFDAAITPYNFLRYDERRWRPFNPSLHYQNRLRHRQYLDLFEQAGLDVVEQETVDGTPEDLAVIGALPPAAPFAGFDPRELAVRRSRVVLRPGAR